MTNRIMIVTLINFYVVLTVNNAIVFKKFQEPVSMNLCFGNDKNALNPNP